MKPEPVRKLERAEHVDLYALYEAQIRDDNLKHFLGDKPPPRPDDYTWCIVYTGPGMERLAMLWLDRGKFISYCPFYVWRQRIRKGPGKGKTLEKSRPVFPSYIFVGRTAKQSYQAVEETKGVVEVLKVAEQRVVVPRQLIERLQDSEAAGEFVHDVLNGGARRVKAGATDEELEQFPKGAVVRVVDGPFASFNATIDQVIGHERFKALIGIFGRLTPVEFTADQLERV